MNIFLVALCLFVQVVDSFKLPSFEANLDTDIQNTHDQFKDSIVNSTVTSVNLSVIHIASEIILLILIISSHKKLSGLIHRISTHLLRNKKTIVKPPSVTSV